MPPPNIGWITNFIWGVADDVLRDLYVRGKYRDVILPMVVLQRLDAVLEPTKQNVLVMKSQLDAAGVVNQELALRSEAGQPFYNTSKFQLNDLRNRGNQQQLRADFEDWLDGFSENVQDILKNFDFRHQLPKLSSADVLGTLVVKFLDPDLKLASLDNHAMGTVFEELVRRFNEENNEEAGEHWTPRDVVKLMSNLIFRPVADEIQSGTYLLYDGAIGTGGMLTVAEQTLRDLGTSHGKDVVTHLYGQEINAETFAICKSDLLLTGEGENADNVVGGPEYSTLSNDAFRGRQFDFMLSNPPYGKSWKTDLERMGGKKGMTDARFVVNHAGDPEYSLITRSSDGQMLFMANLLSKMKHDTPMGSRIAEIHNGSSLFTGDAGQGESNIRRWVIENDWLEAIIQLPENSFYNTGIATYIWVLTNRKPEHRRGKVQLIDASSWFVPLRKNMGAKNCELSSEDIERIIAVYVNFEENQESRIFDNDAFGYRKVKVERPLRLRSQCSAERVEGLRYASGDEVLRREIHDLVGDEIFTSFASVKSRIETHLEPAEDDDDESAPEVPANVRKRLFNEKTWQRDARLYNAAGPLAQALGEKAWDDFGQFSNAAKAAFADAGIKLAAADSKALLRGLSWTDEDAAPVVKKMSKPDKVSADPLFGKFPVTLQGQPMIVEYEGDSDLADFEQVPLDEAGGVGQFFEREVRPYSPDAWVDVKSEKIGYEISFTRVFYKPVGRRSLSKIEADIRIVMAESEGLLEVAMGTGK
ncbi:MAG: SAM-dependent DNA methyltransferase [Actinobacteria bacterium]|nr:SAM-dependent DNA methyltransferase [Actinomycetota bacterium]